MSDIEICPECGSVVVGSGTDQRCTACGLTYEEMVDVRDDEDPDDTADDEFDDDDEDGDTDW